MGDGSSPPQPYSNPSQTAAEQQKLNIGTAAAGQAASMVGQENPFGSLTYAQTGQGPGGIPLYTATTKYSPQMQAILSALQGGVTNQLGTSGYGTQNASDVIGGATSGNTQAMLGKEVSYLQPFFTQQQEQLDNQLRNQGIGPDNPAYTRAMNNLSQSQNQSVTGFLASAAPAAQQMAMNQYLAPLNVSQEMMSLLNPTQFSGSLINPPQASVQPTDYAGIVNAYNQAQQQAYQTQQAANSAMWGNIFRIPSAILGGWAAGPAGAAALGALPLLSDIQTKKDIKRVGTLDNGLPVYLFQYKHAPGYQIGVMAQDVETLNPEAVVEIDGLKHVNYELAVV